MVTWQTLMSIFGSDTCHESLYTAKIYTEKPNRKNSLHIFETLERNFRDKNLQIGI